MLQKHNAKTILTDSVNSNVWVESPFQRNRHINHLAGGFNALPNAEIHDDPG